MTAPPSNKILLTRSDLPRLGLNLSPSTLLRLEAAGQFPKRVRIGAHSVGNRCSQATAVHGMSSPTSLAG